MAETRRGFLKVVTAAMGAVIAGILGFPLVRYLLYPVRKKIVSGSDAPVDVVGVEQLPKDGRPQRVTVYANGVRDAWGVADQVAIGAAWVRKQKDGSVLALSTVCPHLGCAVDYDRAADEYRCPCHKSAFGADGERRSGPSKRGMDPLPLTIEDGRIKLQYVRYRSDVPEREPLG